MADFVFSSKNPQAPLAYFETAAMHSRLELLLMCPDESKAGRLCNEAEKSVKSLEEIFDRHREGSPVFELNRTLSLSGLQEELFFALELCEKFRQLTLGYFDIAALGESRIRPAYNMFPAERKTVLEKGVMIDFGGFAKGYALEVIRRQFEQEGIESALLNFGDSSVVGIGKHPFGDCWQVSAETGGRTFRIKDSAMSTSGVSRGGGTHIVNPHTGENVQHGGNVTVTGRSALVCEVLSTALFSAPESVRQQIMNSFEGYGT